MKLEARLPDPVFGAFFGALAGAVVWFSLEARAGSMLRPEGSPTVGAVAGGVATAVVLAFTITALTSWRSAAPMRRGLGLAGSSLGCLGVGAWGASELLQGQVMEALAGSLSAAFFGVMAWRVSRGEDPADIVAEGSITADASDRERR